ALASTNSVTFSTPTRYYDNRLGMKAASAPDSSDGLKNTVNDPIWLVKMNLMAAARSGDVQCVRTEIVEARSCFVARSARELWRSRLARYHNHGKGAKRRLFASICRVKLPEKLLSPRQDSLRPPVPRLLPVLPHAHVQRQADFLQIGWQLVVAIALAAWLRI